MIPPATLLLSAEMLRDGGSFAAEFQCADSSRYVLLFRVQLSQNAWRAMERTGYLPPVLVDRVPETETALSWDHAHAQVAGLQLLARRDTDADALKLMMEIAESLGKVPTHVSRVLGPVFTVSDLPP